MSAKLRDNILYPILSFISLPWLLFLRFEQQFPFAGVLSFVLWQPVHILLTFITGSSSSIGSGGAASLEFSGAYSFSSELLIVIAVIIILFGRSWSSFLLFRSWFIIFSSWFIWRILLCLSGKLRSFLLCHFLWSWFILFIATIVIRWLFFLSS